MIKILFLCHGNICRSTMAEYVMKHLVKEADVDSEFFIDSAGTSTEEIGNGVHHGTRRKLAQAGIPCGDHRARQVTWADYQNFDLLIGMDDANLRNLRRMLKNDPDGKISLLLDFVEPKSAPFRSILTDAPHSLPCLSSPQQAVQLAGAPNRSRSIADPWYTGDFDATYRDVLEGCRGLLARLRE